MTPEEFDRLHPPVGAAPVAVARVATALVSPAAPPPRPAPNSFFATSSPPPRPSNLLAHAYMIRAGRR